MTVQSFNDTARYRQEPDPSVPRYKPPIEPSANILSRQNGWSEDVQYIRTPMDDSRLVVISEAYFMSLLRRSPVRSGLEKISDLPSDVRRQIDSGENPLVALRTWRGFKQKQLARIAGISPSMLSQMERRGKYGSTRTLLQIADALGVSVDILLQAARLA